MEKIEGLSHRNTGGIGRFTRNAFIAWVILCTQGCKFFTSPSTTNSDINEEGKVEAQSGENDSEKLRDCPDPNGFEPFIGVQANVFAKAYPEMSFEGFIDEPPGHARGMVFGCDGSLYIVYLKRDHADKWFSQQNDWKFKDFETEVISAIYLER